MPWDNPTTDEIDQVHAESRDDLNRLLVVVPAMVDKYGPIRGAVEYATGLIMQPRWDRMELASVLGVALVALHEARAAASTPPDTEETTA